MSSQEQTHKYNLELSRWDMNNIQSELELLKSGAESLKEAERGSKLLAPFKAMTLALRMRKKAKEGMEVPWVFALSLAIACDLVDLLPIAGWIISWIFRPYLFVFLWRTGRWKVTLLRWILMLFDGIPFVDVAPWTTIAVVHAYKEAHKKIKKADKKVEEAEKKVKEVQQQLQQPTPAYADGYQGYPARKAT